jgi:hypothetical protein
LSGLSRPGTFSIVQGDFYTVQLEGQFDLVTCWEEFGLGSDADQRRMLRRISQEWLKPTGCALVDVYFPARPARHTGEAIELGALEVIPGSVDMIEKCHFDVVNSIWIDEWQPTHNPENALAQALRCYAPADLLLLLEGTGLKLKTMEVGGQQIPLLGDRIQVNVNLIESWGYLAQLVRQSN